MLALAPAPLPAAKASLAARRKVVLVSAVANNAAAEGANVNSKTSCVHPGRPVSQACPDCPRRKGGKACMAKSKCIHPQRPLSAACADCPRRKGAKACMAE